MAFRIFCSCSFLWNRKYDSGKLYRKCTSCYISCSGKGLWGYYNNITLLIIVGGIKSISKVSSVVVPIMAIFYVICGLIVIFGSISNLPSGLSMIFKMAFSIKAVGGGLCGSIVASMMSAMRYGVARGVFSNEAGMGSAQLRLLQRLRITRFARAT